MLFMQLPTFPRLIILHCSLFFIFWYRKIQQTHREGDGVRIPHVDQAKNFRFQDAWEQSESPLQNAVAR
jgi:hypothetical protein